MVFSSIIFLWVLLPLILIGYYSVKSLKTKNVILVLFSLIFYAWGEPKYLFLMLASILINYSFGILIEESKSYRKCLMAVCVAANLLILGYFKYFNFFIEILRKLLQNETIRFAEISLPIGISFYTFQALSYVIDVYRNENAAQRNFIHMILYISFFPQLIAGPIVKYHDVEAQMNCRNITVDDFVYAIERFIIGLGKKVILANSFAEIVDQVYQYQPCDISTGLLWFTALLYMFQIYFDFSGYSDMAIGLGKMFGFTFQENFNLPYAAHSIRDFWRKWHISLSSWFREYVYIPLGGNRKGTVRTYLNLSIVFFLTGLWHGAGWTFILWGIYHGFFIILERAFLENWLQQKHWRLTEQLYTIFVVFIGWIFFRAETLTQALDYIHFLFIPHDFMISIERFWNIKMMLLTLLGILFSGLPQIFFKNLTYPECCTSQKLTIPKIGIYLFVLWTSIMLLVNNTYNPFIYFRF